MSLRPPAQPGMLLDQVDTPALIVDLDALDRNIAVLQAAVDGAPGGVRLRPHAKTHKSVDVARRQCAAGAIGVCCQTVQEAEAMVQGDITDVLLSNQVASPDKARRLAALAVTARVAVCVDHLTQAELLSKAASAASAEMGILVELDVGAGRCGLATTEEVVALALAVARLPHLRFDGVQAYHGPAQHYRAPFERAHAIAAATVRARDAVDALRAAGLAVTVVAGAGTGSYVNELGTHLYTELQCGSYVFMDVDYGRNRGDQPFVNALFLLSTVISAPAAGRRGVCDAGLKAMSTDSGMPEVVEPRNAVYVKASDEHGHLDAPMGGAALCVGDRVRLIPGHCDPTVAQHDWLVAFRGDTVEALWPVARGHG